MMWIQKQHFFEIRLLVQTYSFIYRSSIDMILKVTSNFKIPWNMFICLSQRNLLCIVIVSVSENSILSIIIKHILIIIFCNDDRDQMLWGYWHVFLYVILFICKIPMQVLFQIKLSQKQMSGDFLGIQAFTWWFDCVHSFPSVWGHFLVFRANVSWNGYLICAFTSISHWFNISDLLDVYKILR